MIEILKKVWWLVPSIIGVTGFLIKLYIQFNLMQAELINLQDTVKQQKEIINHFRRREIELDMRLKLQMGIIMDSNSLSKEQSFMFKQNNKE